VNQTTWTANLAEHGLLLAQAIHQRVPSVPASYARQLCKKQRISVNNRWATPETFIESGDLVRVKPSQRWRSLVDSCPLQPHQILYEDRECLVINKPSGTLVHSAKHSEDDLLSRINSYYKMRGDHYCIAPIHRLDMETSGAVLFGKGKKAIGCLGKAMMSGSVKKKYLAIVHGVVSEPGHLKSFVRAKGCVKLAETKYRPLIFSRNKTLLELELITGRNHQIRQHLSQKGCAIAGDRRSHSSRDQTGVRLMLHCHLLEFNQPSSGKTISIQCKVPSDICTCLRELCFSSSDIDKFCFDRHSQ
jgi:RluA family pseudouridine synthase